MTSFKRALQNILAPQLQRVIMDEEELRRWSLHPSTASSSLLAGHIDACRRLGIEEMVVKAIISAVRHGRASQHVLASVEYLGTIEGQVIDRRIRLDSARFGYEPEEVRKMLIEVMRP